jgi:hypothetical protein
MVGLKKLSVPGVCLCGCVVDNPDNDHMLRFVDYLMPHAGTLEHLTIGDDGNNISLLVNGMPPDLGPFQELRSLTLSNWFVGLDHPTEDTCRKLFASRKLDTVEFVLEHFWLETIHNLNRVVDKIELLLTHGIQRGVPLRRCIIRLPHRMVYSLHPRDRLAIKLARRIMATKALAIKRAFEGIIDVELHAIFECVHG